MSRNRGAASPAATAVAADGPTVAAAGADVTEVWRALEKASFAIVAFVTPGGEPRTSGVVYAMVDGRMVVVTAADSWKARTIGDGELVSVTVPVRRGGLLSLVLPIPPASVTFRARTTMHPPGSVEIGSLSKRLASMVPVQRRSGGAVLELVPEGSFLNYGIGVSLRDMRDPAVATTRIPVAKPGPPESLTRRERMGLLIHRLLDKWLTPLGVWLLRRTKGGLAKPWKADVLLLSTHGRRSGRERTVVLQYFSDGETMVVTAANDGGDAYPGWYHNLKAEPSAWIEVDGRHVTVRAEELPTDEAATWWSRIVERDPSYARFRRATSRPFPILRLVSVASDAPAEGPREAPESAP